MARHKAKPYRSKPAARASRDKRDVEQKVLELTQMWKAQRGATSSTVAMAMHPAYQQIIGLGARGVPLILRELRRAPDHWFWALKAITGEDPVPPQSRGGMQEMADAWLEWGRQKGYVR